MERKEENIPKSSRSVEMDWAHARIMSPSARENKLGSAGINRKGPHGNIALKASKHMTS